MIEMLELLPCPFCGGKAEEHYHTPSVRCGNTDCIMHGLGYMHPDLWNTRSDIHAEVTAERDRLREALEIVLRCIDANTLILPGSAYDRMIQKALEGREE